MPTLKPHRKVDSYDIDYNFTFNTSGTYPTNRGTFVKIASGFIPDQDPIKMLGAVGAAYANTVSQRYGISPFVATVNNSGDTAFGMLLYDVAELDENGQKYIFHPDLAAQRQVTLSGQPCAIVRKGDFIYSGIEGALPTAQSSPARLGNNGGLTASGGAGTQVGIFMGPATSNGLVFLKLNITQ